MHDEEPVQALWPQPQNRFTGSGGSGDLRHAVDELSMLDRVERQATYRPLMLEAECQLGVNKHRSGTPGYVRANLLI
jgi:hypothetical protein